MIKEENTRLGIMLAGSAFLMWGLMPIYFKAIGEVDSVEIVAHRVVWSVVFGILLMLATNKLAALTTVLRSYRLLGSLALTTLLIGGNWLVFVWTIESERMLDASLGYYINPLMNMLVGFLVLGERMRPLQRIAAGLAVLGVAVEIIKFGSVPWIALFLASTFCFYGLLRKRLPVDSQTGLLLETLLLSPLALGYLLWLDSPTSNLFSNSLELNTLLVMAGPLTMMPLILFAAGVRRIQLTTLGFLQYLAPSLMFLLALYYGEPLTQSKTVTFTFIWGALVLVTWDVARLKRSLGEI